MHESQERVQQVLDDAGIEYNRVVDNGNGGTIDISEHSIGDIDAVKDVLANAGIDSYWVLRYIDDQNEGLTEEVDVNINDKTAAEDAVKIEDSEQEPINEELDKKDYSHKMEDKVADVQIQLDDLSNEADEEGLSEVSKAAKEARDAFEKKSIVEDSDVDINDDYDASIFDKLGDDIKKCWTLEDLEKVTKQIKKAKLPKYLKTDLMKSVFKQGRIFKAKVSDLNRIIEDPDLSMINRFMKVESVDKDSNKEAEDAEKLEDCKKDPILDESLNEGLIKAGDIVYMTKSWGGMEGRDIEDRYFSSEEAAIKDASQEQWNSSFSLYKVEFKDAGNGKLAKDTQFIRKLDESLKEDLDEVSVKADDQEVNVSVEPDGKLNISIDPKAEEENVANDAEMIAPLTDEEQTEITGEAEAPVEEAPAEDEFEVDEFDEDSFNDLGESFLKRVYENVNSFNTSKVSYKKGQLVVEGLIKFNSGKEKATKFVFEGFKNTKRGKTLVAGINEMFSKSNRAFLLKGNLANKKFVSESLTYNYTAKSINESNESDTVRVYGRAVIRK